MSRAALSTDVRPAKGPNTGQSAETPAARFLSQFGGLPIAAALIDATDVSVVTSNQRFREVLHRDGDAGSLWELLDADGDERLAETFREVLEGRSEQARAAVRLRVGSGEVIHPLAIVSAMPASLYGEQHRLCLVVDQSVQERRERWAIGLFDLIGDLAATVSASGFLIDVNAAWTDTLGWSSEELRSRPYLEFIHPDDVEHTARWLARLTDGDVPEAFANRHRTVDGAYRRVLWSARCNARDALIYCLGKDVTAQRLVDDRLAAKDRELERSNRDLQQFAYVASHDLSEPLRAIAGYVQLLSRRYRGQLDATADEFIDFTVDGVTRMQALIQALLAYGLAGSSMQMSSVNTDRLARAVAVTLATANPKASFEFVGLPVVRSDPTALQQIFENLLSNAIKYVPDDRTATVRVSAAGLDDGGWRFTISDNGIGIDAEHHEKIFKMFQRLHDRSQYSGTGIGLAICQRLVDRLGGELSVTSNSPAGAAFHFTLPPDGGGL